jgi:hypothetical protein
MSYPKLDTKQHAKPVAAMLRALACLVLLGLGGRIAPVATATGTLGTKMVHIDAQYPVDPVTITKVIEREPRRDFPAGRITYSSCSRRGLHQLTGHLEQESRPVRQRVPLQGRRRSQRSRPHTRRPLGIRCVLRNAELEHAITTRRSHPMCPPYKKSAV